MGCTGSNTKPKENDLPKRQQQQKHNNIEEQNNKETQPKTDEKEK